MGTVQHASNGHAANGMLLTRLLVASLVLQVCVSSLVCNGNCQETGSMGCCATQEQRAAGQESTAPKPVSVKIDFVTDIM